MNRKRIVISNMLKRSKKIMKLTFLMLIASLSQIAAASYAQTALLNVSAQNETLENVLKQIEKQSEFLFFYNLDGINKDKRLSLDKQNSPIQDVMDAVASAAGIAYTIKNRHIVLIPAGASSPLAIAQQATRKITGVVRDESGEPAIGANVLIKGTSIGTTTDIDGRFALDVPENAVLQVSYIGYLNQEVSIRNQTSLLISLSEDMQRLDEIVVVGYGVQKKRDLVGAVSSVKMSDTPVGTFSTVSHALAGKASGLRVTQNSAQVGGGSKFRIRGETSISAGNDPLVIIDGFPVSASSDLKSGNRYSAGNMDNILESINPGDIESIEILKDAGATAIYGSRAGHGVIIVTTKRGKAGKLQVNYSGNFSVQTMKNAYNMLDSKEYMTHWNQVEYERYLKNNGMDIYAGYITPNPNPAAFTPRYSDAQIADAQTTDWFKEVTRTGLQQSHSISLAGGSESTQYMASLNYFTQNGVIRNNDMDRLTMNVNLDQKISKYVKAGLSINVSRNQYDNVPLGDSEWENAGVIVSAVLFTPFVPVRDENGDYSKNPDMGQIPNPASLLEITDKTVKDRLLGSAYLQVEPLEGLVMKASLGIDRKNAKRKNYLPTTTIAGAVNNGSAYIAQNDMLDYLMELTANYSKTIDNHTFNGLVGYSYQEFNNEGFYAGNYDFPIDGFLYNNLAAGAGAKPTIGSSASKKALGSYFGRINYSFMGKYLLTATLRADGASNFNPDYRWGYFPSASLGWRFSDESFMKSLSGILSNGKLRGGYGQTGNSNVGNRILDTYGVGTSYVFGSTGYTGIVAKQLGNPKLTWETTSEFNIGLDLGFLNNRINASLEYYDRTISDLLVEEKTLLSYNEITKIAANVGKTQGQGFELTLNTVNITRKDLFWTTDLTFSTYKDRWKERDPEWKPAAYQSVTDPIRSIFLYKSDGLMKVGETAPVWQPALLPGQIKIQNLRDEDGRANVMDQYDRVLIGTEDPEFTFGFNNTLKYKNIDLNIYFYGEVGRWRGASYYDSWISGNAGNNFINVSRGTFNSWFHDNQNATHPNVIVSNYTSYANDYYYKKISYARCRNITLGYTIPVSKKVANSIRLYADVNNPFVITNWNGVDPETDSDRYSYPNVTSFSFGVDISF
jgi:TonB-linked SusC/RagA family outer membrane protein